MKKALCLALAILLTVMALPSRSFAAEKEETSRDIFLQYPDDVVLQYPQDYGSVQSDNATKAQFEDYLTDDFVNYLLTNFAMIPYNFSIAQYNIPAEFENFLQDYIWYELPEAFQVYGLGIYVEGDVLSEVYASYETFADTPEEYQSCLADMKEGAQELLQGIEGNNALTDVEKALLLHDRLALWTAYSYEDYLNNTLPRTVYKAYGALGQQSAVCQGYAMAYMYLLKRVGIESDYCTSENMNHGWNIVYIDGEAYHVDVTWDDPVWDEVGFVRHNNFLRSTQGIIASGHNGGDFDTTPTSTKYDDYYWQDSEDPFLLIENDIYYMAGSDNTIYRVDGTTQTEVFTIEVNDYFYDVDVAFVGELLLYSTQTAIYAVDPKTETTNLVYKPDLSADEERIIAGFKYEKGKIVCYINTDRYGQQQLPEDFVYYSFVPDKTKTYTVTFKNTDGTVITQGQYYYGQVVVAPILSDEIDENGYIECWDREVTVCLGKTTYTKTTNKEKDHKVTYVDWDGSVVETQWYNHNDLIDCPEILLVRDEDEVGTYTYVGWELIEGQWDIRDNRCVDDLVYKAVYEISYKEYTVNFCDWNGSIWRSYTYYWGENVYVPAGPNRGSDEYYTYEFIGWDKAVSTTCNGDATYTATYEATQKPQQTPKNGWELENGKWYYYKNNVKKTGWLKDGNDWYYFNAEGVMQTGWIQSGNIWYYLKPSGNMATGWAQVGGFWYYFDGNGVMKTGWLQVDGIWYYFKSAGNMATGWCQVGSTWYYFNTSGAMQTGWLKLGSTWYYFNTGGAMQTGWLKLGSTWYYFKSSGAMATGTVTVGTKTYRFNSSGACLNP